MERKNIVVIGGGFGGLAAAVRLAALGHQVTIFEKRDKAGGRGYVYEIDGFQFDGGPTVITAPFMFDDIFRAAGRRREDYITFVSLSPFYRIFDHEKKVFNYNGDPAFTAEQIRAWNPADAEGYARFVRTTKPIFEKGFLQLADKPFLHVSDMLRIAPELIALQAYRSVYGYVSRFVRNEFLRRCFSFHPLLIGGNPFDSSAIYAMIHYLEREWGVHFAMGGTGAVIRGLTKLFGELGGTLHLNSEVAEIVVDGRRVSGVRLADGAFHPADTVVCNAEVADAYLRLLPPRRSWIRWRIRTMEYSMSLFVIYFGTKRRYLDSGLAHHNIILSRRYKGLLDDIFRRKVLAEDFSLYLHMPTITDPSIAPPGCELFYVLSPVPHLGSGVDWRQAAKPYRDRIMDFLEKNYLPDLQRNIVAEHMIDPLHFRDTLNSHLGSAFSVQPTLPQSAWFRPHNRSEDYDNLYFVGAGTHPGAGLPGVLSSAIIAERMIRDAG
ncbi:MAG: phytoene desaturase [Anaerolineales bacterium]|nr:phytoene desaturase [Anaerolineales bacterium]